MLDFFPWKFGRESRWGFGNFTIALWITTIWYTRYILQALGRVFHVCDKLYAYQGGELAIREGDSPTLNGFQVWFVISPFCTMKLLNGALYIPADVSKEPDTL